MSQAAKSPRSGRAARPRPGRLRRRPARCRRCSPCGRRTRPPPAPEAHGPALSAPSAAGSGPRPAAGGGTNRAAGRPPSSIAIDRSQPVSPVLERRCRSDRPATCSTNVLREQVFRSQKYRRTRCRTMTRRDPNGLSIKMRWYVLCMRLACFRQSGHRPGRAVDTTPARGRRRSRLRAPLTHRSRETAQPRPSCSPCRDIPCRNDPSLTSLTWEFTELRTEP